MISKNKARHNMMIPGVVTVYSVTHFLVDFACAFLMFRAVINSDSRYLCVLFYNFFAFAFQMPLGLIADKCSRNHLFATAGCLLIAAAYGLAAFPVMLAVTLGIGNALFHIGGGVDILNISISKKKIAALGVFVSPGAFGVYFGTILGTGNVELSVYIIATLIIAATGIVALRRLQGDKYTGNATFSLNGSGDIKVVIAIVCLFLVVAVRSFVGLSLNFSWKSIELWGLLLICAVVFGKTAGGFLTEKIGILATTCLSLGLATLLFMFSALPLPGIIAVFAFNMTMPITLWIMADLLKGAKGFSFGLLTFALFLGFLPVYLGVQVPADTVWRICLAAAGISILLMFAVIWNYARWIGEKEE